ncbi:MAG: hypothetical protein PF795_00510 [Kiritimatiellae bacterium]|jgi:hypothetical protein|nr:hypothetical protein [Kiritimatiellia bacterium]
MYTILIVVLLILSVATFFLSKSRPVFKPVGFVLPIVAILNLIFTPGGQDALSVSQKVLDEEAKGVGEQLARVITNTIPKKGLILVIHPEESAPTYSLGRVEEHLQGLEDALESSGYPLSTHSLVEQDAVNDPLTDGI